MYSHVPFSQQHGQSHIPYIAPAESYRVTQLGLLDAIITQNVDGLHQEAGAASVIEFHGSLLQSACRACRAPGGDCRQYLSLPPPDTAHSAAAPPPSGADAPPASGRGGPLPLRLTMRVDTVMG